MSWPARARAAAAVSGCGEIVASVLTLEREARSGDKGSSRVVEENLWPWARENRIGDAGSEGRWYTVEDGASRYGGGE